MREPANNEWSGHRWAERTLDYQGIVRGRAAVCYRNNGTERAIYGPSYRTGWLAFPRAWFWAARRFKGLPVRRIKAW